MLKLSVLGPTHVLLDDQPVDKFISDKVLALFCYLAVSGAAQARQTLAGLLWSDMPETRAKANLRMALYDLQQHLPTYFRITRKVVAFDREQPQWLDVTAFETALAAFATTADVRELQAAVDLYRGAFLEGLMVDGAALFEEWVRDQRRQWQQQLVTALETLSEQYSQQAEWPAAIEATRRLLNVEPWRERAHRQLMHLLARSGQYSAALAQYDICRQCLREELDVEPMPETVALYERIRAARTRPRGNNLPLQPTPFIGREDELAQLHRMLADDHQRLITVTGPGGIGKTRLALEAAAAYHNVFLDGVLFVPLAEVESPALLPHAIAGACGESLAGPESPHIQLLAILRRKELLLVLDSFEHLEGAELLSEILAAAPAVRMLVTSRQAQQVRWETQLPLHGLPYPERESAVHPSQYAAVQLFEQTVRRRQPDFTLSPTDADGAVQICRIVEGMPLAIELAGVWAPTHACATIAQTIAGNLSALTTPLRDVPQRQQSMAASFEHSWQLLSAEEQRVYRKLSVFRGGFDAAAAHQVAGASADLLAALVSKSLLKQIAPARYNLHLLLRRYAAAKLGEHPTEEAATRRRHAHYYTQFVKVREEALKGVGGRAVIDEVETEFANLRHAWHWAIVHHNAQMLDDALWALWILIELRGRPGIIRPLFEHGLAKWDRSDETPASKVILAKLQLGKAWTSHRLGDLVQSTQLMTESLAVLQQFGLPADRALAHLILGANLVLQGELTSARTHLYASRSLFRALADRWGLEGTTFYLGEIAWLRGELAEAKRCYEETLAICQSVNHETGIIFCLRRLGDVAHAQQDLESAEQLYAEGLALAVAMDNLRQQADLRFRLGVVARERQENEQARQWLRHALRDALDIQVAPSMLDIFVEVSRLFQQSDRREEAVALLDFVRRHPACRYETQQKADVLLDEMASALPAAHMATVEDVALDVLRFLDRTSIDSSYSHKGSSASFKT